MQSKPPRAPIPSPSTMCWISRFLRKFPAGGRLALATIFALVLTACNGERLSEAEIERAAAFVLAALPPLPPDPTNGVADDPRAAVLGEKLFFDSGLSANGEVACATCHQPERGFQDGLRLGRGIGEAPRRTMALPGAAYGAWFFWDGRKDSQWSQALEPLETPAEHGMTRDRVARHVLDDYRDAYEALFGPAPDTDGWPENVSPLIPGKPMDEWWRTPAETRQAINRVFANTGKVLAAYQRRLKPVENRFDRYVAALTRGEAPAAEDRLSADELAGFRLFTGKARCDNCHSGPLFTDHFFHNTGVPVPDRPGVDYGRALAVLFLKEDEFSCIGRYSDAAPGECRELRFMAEDPALFEGAFKTPGLRGVADRAPFMHAGQLASLAEVVDHYVEAPDPFADIPDPDGTITPHGRHSAIRPLDLSEAEKRQLIAFLKLL